MVLNPTLCYTVPGRLVLNPTNLQAVYPYGGTALGFVTRWRLVREQKLHEVSSEALGRDGVAVYGGRYRAAAAFVLVQWDNDVLQKLYAYSTTSPNGYSGASILTVPKSGQTTLSPGVIASSSPLLFAADDPSLPSALFLAPIFTLGPKLELDMTLDRPSETGVVVVAGIDASGNDLRIDKIENLSLT